MNATAPYSRPFQCENALMTSGIITPAVAVSEVTWESPLEPMVTALMAATSPAAMKGCSHWANTALTPVSFRMVPSATEAGQMKRMVIGKCCTSVGIEMMFSPFLDRAGQKKSSDATMKKSGEKLSQAKLGPFTYGA